MKTKPKQRRALKTKRKQRRALNKKPAFLKALAICGSITEAAAAIRVDRSLHYDWLKVDPNYRPRFEAAREIGRDALEDEATYRAMHGVFVPNVHQGRFVYPREEYEVTPAIPAGDWKDAEPTPAVPAVMAWRDVPGAPPLGTWVKSDRLLELRLKGEFAKYRQGALEVTGAGGGAIQSEHRIVFVKPGA
jgi:hypothetical protein